MPPLCYLDSTTLHPRNLRRQRGTKEVAKRRHPGEGGYFRGEIAVRHPFPGSPSQVLEDSITFLNEPGSG
jgi:hypothetical protein